MKHFIKIWVFYVVALWFVQQIFPAFVIQGGWQPIFLAGLLLSLLMLVVRPLLKILFIPINILTFGLLSWFVNVIVIYVFTLIAPNVSITAWQFPGWSWQGFSIPGTYLSYFLCLVITSICITGITNFLEDITD